MIQVEGFNVRIVEHGDWYGRDDCLEHSGDPLVEFYDAKQDPAKFGRRGQFVTRFHLHDLLAGDYPHGLSLDGGIPAWSISTAGMREVKRHLSGYLQSQS